MRLITIAYIVCCVASAFAQDEIQMAMESKLETLRYPSLPKAARIQGNVLLRSTPKGVELVSGNPLLAPAALEDFKAISQLLDGRSEVLFHFILVDPNILVTRTRIKKGDAIDRFFLRILRIKTEKILEEYDCVENKADVPRVDLTKNPVEISISASTPCVEVISSTYIAAR